MNNELGDLERSNLRARSLTDRRRRLVVISFRSTEDRIVRLFMRKRMRARPDLFDLPVVPRSSSRAWKLLGKPQYASEEELKANPRARAARCMRVAEKLGCEQYSSSSAWPPQLPHVAAFIYGLCSRRLPWPTAPTGTGNCSTRCCIPS